MKLTNEHKAQLGIECDGEDVPDEQVWTAIDALSKKAATVPENLAELNARAAAGDTLVDEKRTEVTRLAKLAELGAEEGELPEVIADDIKAADVKRLQSLGEFYGKKVAEKFPKDGRSSLEDNEKIDNAGGVTSNEAELPKVGLL